MTLSRTELQAQLAQLEADLPTLPQDFNFIEAFAARADAIAEAAAPGADRDWVEDQAIAILERHDLVEKKATS